MSRFPVKVDGTGVPVSSHRDCSPGEGELVAQSNERLFHQVVAENGARQESYEIDRPFAQCGKPGGLSTKLAPKKSCCHKYRLYEIQPIHRIGFLSSNRPGIVPG